MGVWNEPPLLFFPAERRLPEQVSRAAMHAGQEPEPFEPAQNAGPAEPELERDLLGREPLLDVFPAQQDFVARRGLDENFYGIRYLRVARAGSDTLPLATPIFSCDFSCLENPPRSCAAGFLVLPFVCTGALTSGRIKV